MTMPNEADVSVAQLPELTRLAAFTVAGVAGRFSEANKANIPQLWSKLIGALPLEGQDPGWTTYGVVWGVEPGEGSFAYMAGVKVAPGASLPSGFTAIDIPAADYAVFRITLNGGPVHPQVKAAMGKIWGELVPATGLKVAQSPDFELYDGEFAPDRPGAVIDFHLPVEIN